MKRFVLLCGIAGVGWGAPREVTFTPGAVKVEAYDFVEIVANVSGPDAGNPFTGATLRGTFGNRGGTAVSVDGFCDSAAGTVYRIRFMPPTPGEYTYSVSYRQGDFEKTTTGIFTAMDGRRRGPVRVDPKYPWHFIWEGTGEHYYFNGTTAFWLMGWKEDRHIDFSIERLRRMKINRIRVLLDGAANMFWGDKVMTGANFSMTVRPWVARRPSSFENPEIDYTRFDVAYWRRWERMLRFTRDRDMVISVILDISTHRAQPTAGSEDERRYIRYAVARLGAFSNITWDLGDDLDSFRDELWTHQTGTLLQSWDPYRHLATSHPVKREHQDRGAEWFGFTSIQDWSRSQHTLMLEERQFQLKTGRIIPQTNEEYGYEDHYPQWAPAPPGDSAETLRRMAWEIAMAGAYGTAGETARRGTNVWPDTGGGWINGRGDDTMTMLKGYEHMVDFFLSFEWWKAEPHDELVAANNGAYCLAKPGEIYAVYLPKGGTATVRLEPGTYSARWFNAFTGEIVDLPIVSGGSWTSPAAPGWLDWALLLVRKPGTM
jgi:hypothetical protein